MDSKTTVKAVSTLIKQFGSVCKITYVDGTTANAWGAVVSPSTTTDGTTYVTDKTLVCWLEGTLKKAPAPGDFIKIGKQSYNVERVDTVQPDGKTTYVFAAYVRT